MDEYNDIKDLLKPRRDFAASDELRYRIGATLDSNTRKRRHLRWVWGLGTSCVAAAMLILILVPTGMSAKEILTATLSTLLNTGGIEMTVEVRTRPMENFRYINLSDDFVIHDISIAKSESNLSWRIDKGGRTATGDNDVIYNWIDQLNIGWRTVNAAPDEILGEMAILLTPEKILESELQNCLNHTDAGYKLQKKGDEITLTVHSRPRGNFSNHYMLNTSVAEPENIRRYVIDASTMHLKSASVSVINDKKETEVLKITKIVYRNPEANLTVLPSDIKFIDLSYNNLQGLTGLTATEAASAFLNALESWNVAILDNAVDANMKNGMYEKDLKGSVLVSVGKSFTSGNEGTTFVPYELRTHNGTYKRHNLALQKSSQGGWIVVGGL